MQKPYQVGLCQPRKRVSVNIDDFVKYCNAKKHKIKFKIQNLSFTVDYSYSFSSRLTTMKSASVRKKRQYGHAKIRDFKINPWIDTEKCQASVMSASVSSYIVII